MKVLFVTNNYTPYSGGVVQSINTFANQLRKTGVTVFIVTLQFQKGQKLKEPNVFRLWCPIRFLYKNNHMAIPIGMRRQLKKVIDDIQPDIIHTHHPFLLGRAAMSIGKKKNIPIIFTHHTQYERYSHYVPIVPALAKPIINKIVSTYCNEVDLIVAPSNSSKQKLVTHVFKPINVIPSPIRDIFFERKQTKKRESDKLELLTVSRFAPEKNIPFLLDAVKQLPEHSFHFTLAGYGHYLNYLKSYAYKRLELNVNAISFVEKPSLHMLKELYDQADLFLFASQTETQGLVLAEAMACKMPVIALKGPGQNDIVKDGANGYLITNQQEMAKKISLLSSCPDQLSFLADNAEFHSKEYSCKKATSKLCKLYDSIFSS